MNTTLTDKPIWTTKDIVEYFGVSTTTAWRIKKEAIQNGGRCPYGNNYVLSEVVLKLFGLKKKKEI